MLTISLAGLTVDIFTFHWRANVDSFIAYLANRRPLIRRYAGPGLAGWLGSAKIYLKKGLRSASLQINISEKFLEVHNAPIAIWSCHITIEISFWKVSSSLCNSNTLVL